MPNTICQRCVISGRVQGVFYRATAAHKAKELNITGYAKNL
ncbi:MAG TPA: acylphosphatase, partial [Gammaproteobacteria bacterium]|nr:acylphosphatase [Gammaproteobacteria bacterium]